MPEPLPSSPQVAKALLRRPPAANSPKIIQVATGGRWEAARSIEMPAGPAAARSLVRDAGPAHADVAVEFEWLGTPLTFVGVRRAQDDHERFEDDVVRVAELNPAEPWVALTTLAGGPPTELSHVELGAANAWKSVGPMRIWSEGQPWPPAPDAAAARLDEHPALGRCTVPVALEVTFSGPRECWVGVEVSERAADAHVITPAALAAVIERLAAAPR